MKKIFILIILIQVAFFIFPQNGRPKAGILNFSYNSQKIDAALVHDIEKLFISALISSGKYSVMRNSSTDQQKSDLTARSADEFNDEMRKLIQIDHVFDIAVLGNLSKFGDKYALSVRYVSIETGGALYGGIVEFYLNDPVTETFINFINEFDPVTGEKTSVKKYTENSLQDDTRAITRYETHYTNFKKAGTTTLTVALTLSSIGLTTMILGYGLFGYAGSYYGLNYGYDRDPETAEAEAARIVTQDLFYSGFILIYLSWVISGAGIAGSLVAISLLSYAGYNKYKLQKMYISFEPVRVRNKSLEFACSISF